MVLGLLLIYYIGKYFFQLAEKFNRNKWRYAILSIVVYYAGTAVGGIIVGIVAVILDYNIDNNTAALGLLTVPFGIGADYLFYYILKRNWEKDAFLIKDEIQEIGTSDEDLL